MTACGLVFEENQFLFQSPGMDSSRIKIMDNECITDRK